MSKIHWFGDVGYRHNPWTHCPADELSYSSGRCLCPREDNFDEDVFPPPPSSMLMVLGLFMFTAMVENCRQVMVCGVDEFVVAYMHIIYPGSWVEFIALVAGLFLYFVLFL